MTYNYNAYVTSVYDADTITCDINLGFGVVLHKQKIRLFGIDAPELRGSEKDEGIKSRDYMRGMILNKNIIIKTIKDKKGKYGRWLGIVYLNDINLNELLVKEGYAVKADY